ncbi:structure-specific endonuclease subunit SLX4-like [Hoplias malabaricus]|uniref:structure-specific endonuclease subunit SLX4-like n=1 Tax=Hoplias malabaricus TaxID=27720 RepID=UPI003462FD20
MDDSDEEFSDLCSRLLKRVKRKESDEKKRTAVPSRRRRDQKNSQPQSEKVVQTQANCHTEGTSSLGLKENVLRRMERFKRESPPRLFHEEKEKGQCNTASSQIQEPMEESESDEVLALRLQQQLDREAETVVPMDDGDLFFCQLCHKDLSSMSPQLRTQHINRCLDQSEDSASEALLPRPLPRPRVPECPICGRSFKSEKSRSAHLKRCSASMGVSPAELLQALQRQADESERDNASDHLQRTEGSRRPPESSIPAKKKARKKAPRLDEDTMVALALSRSLLEQEKERERKIEDERQIQAQLSSPPTAAAPMLQLKPRAGKIRGRRRKGASAASPSLLLIQDPQTAQNRIQERVSSLLLCPRPPTPPTPKLLPSKLPMWAHSTPLWLKSALPGGGPHSISEFYTVELGAFIQPWVRPEKMPPLSSEVTPMKQHSSATSKSTADSQQPSNASPSLDQNPSEHPTTPIFLTPAMSTPGSQALRDLVELAEEGMTLTQYGHKDKEPAGSELQLSGFVPETTKITKPPVSSVSVSKLCSDLSSMVNNPQLSDIQLQVDSGDVYFAHSFMLYTRCPLLASMVHDAGFGVEEDGMPRAQRLLLSDVPCEAVYSLLQYLYTAFCPLTKTLLHHIHQLAIRFDLPELCQQCEQYNEDPEGSNEEECLAQEPDLGPQQTLADTQFLELLCSLWQHEENDSDEFGETEPGEAERGMDEEEERGGNVDGEKKEDRVNEEELDEIYEFVATQRKMEATRSFTTSDEEEEEDEEEKESTGTVNGEHEKQNTEAGQKKEVNAASFKEANTSHHSYRLGEDKDAAAMVTSATNMHHIPDSHADVCLYTSDTQEDLNNNPNASLDKSYNRLFSESWGEYLEPSQVPADQKNTPAPHQISSVSEVIDLSISPPPGSGEPGELSFPVAGMSPDEGEPSIPAQDPVPPPFTSKLKSIQIKLSSSEHSPPQSSKIKFGLVPLVSSMNPKLLPPVPNKAQPDISTLGSSCKQPELIVLSDCSDDIDVDPLVDMSSSQGVASSPSPCSSPPKLSQRYIPLRAKESIEVRLSPKETEEIESSKLNQSEHGLCRGAEGQNMLDGSAELSWLIPATPEVSTCSSSTQTHSSMRRTQLFPKSDSSSSSSVPDISQKSRYSRTHPSSLLRDKPASPRLSPDQMSSRVHSIIDVPEHSPVFQKPASSENGLLLSSMPTSSTPLHSAPCPQPPEPLGSPLLKHCKLRVQNRGVFEDYDEEYEERAACALSLQVGPAKTTSQRTIIGLECLHHDQSDKLRPPHTTFEPFEKTSVCLSVDHYETGDERSTREKEKNGIEEGKNRSMNEVEMIEEASFCAYDEPPIAFNDSWGLGSEALGDQNPCFSLRLESSEDQGSLPDHRVQGEMSARNSVSPPVHQANKSAASVNQSLPDPVAWDSWEENEEDGEELALPLSQRVGTAAPPKRVAQLKTPVARMKKNNQVPMVPITPMPGFSDMDTPELKKRLDRYGVRPLPKKQMVLKLKEIHQYTHQLISSESEEEASPVGQQRAGLPLAVQNLHPALLSFKQPTAPPPVSPRKLQFGKEEDDVLPASQESNTSSTESERSNPELCESDDDGSDSEGITASQAAVREKDKLLAVRAFILSDPVLYGRLLQYQPLSLSDLKAKLRAAGVRLGTAKLLDFLDSQCITVTTAKSGHSAPSRRRKRVRAPAAGTGCAGSRGRKRKAKPAD